MEFPENFKNEIQPHRDLIISALKAAYQNGCDRHDPKIGDNATTFGITLYYHACHMLEQTNGAIRGAAEILSKAPGAFRIRLGAVTMALHKVGNQTPNDFDNCILNRSVSIARDLEYTGLYLPGFEPDYSKMTKGVICHFGNPEEGLRSVYVAIPGRIENEKILEWGPSYLLWKAEDAIEPATKVETPRETERPAAQIVPEAQLSKKMRKTHEHKQDA